ncbi:aldo/keto reductase [Nocardioides sp. WL0053]|uniref:Aldo/keto reductase n=1 Tax=Nocardioides jiangsuensis TaxID=2866161 RepID=A0ABS7REJ6_9ACTN|nr:aldo/keto reductase [Nocardioides jiangsuensis]MBY9073427.1 aldo/keto reductase [Nocardioides jiangsuensis]
MSHDVHPLVLNNGVRIPQLGFGVYKIPEAATRDAVLTAFAAGYRHIDTAALYRNERGVGEAVRESGLPRDEVFVTSKVWNDDHGYDATLRAFDASMERLGLDVLDLYLIHWPVPRLDRYVDTWRALEQLYRDGRVRAIGVSNFQPDHLRRLLDRTDVVPVVNQVELHPYLQQEKLRVAHEELGLLTEAWAPLARGGELLADRVVLGLADKHARTPAQVVLRWHLQLGNVVIPKSVTPARIAENIAVFDFALDEDDMAVLASLDREGRTGAHPDHLG